MATADPRDFAPTVQGELPTPFQALSPLLDMSRHDLPAPPSRPRPAVHPIPFPDPEKVLREREQRARDERARENAAYIEEQRQVELVGDAYRNGRDYGFSEGYVAGVRFALWMGVAAGFILGAAGFMAIVKLALWWPV